MRKRNIQAIRMGICGNLLAYPFILSSFATLPNNILLLLMIKQDYLIRMILEIITLIAKALLNRQKIRPQQWVEYDCLTRQLLGMPSEDLKNLDADMLMNHYADDLNRMGKLELAALTQLKIADELADDQLVLKSRLRHEGIRLLEYVQNHGDTFSLQRASLIALLKNP